MDETREYGTWADWLGVPRHTFLRRFGAVIARGQDYRETFQVFRPGFDLAEERERRAAAGKPEDFGEENLYRDVRPCPQALQDAGLLVGVAGNQTTRAEQILKGAPAPDGRPRHIGQLGCREAVARLLRAGRRAAGAARAAHRSHSGGIDANVENHLRSGLPGDATAVALLWLALNRLIMDRLTLPDLFTEAQRRDLVAELVARLV